MNEIGCNYGQCIMQTADWSKMQTDGKMYSANQATGLFGLITVRVSTLVSLCMVNSDRLNW